MKSIRIPGKIAVILILILAIAYSQMASVTPAPDIRFTTIKGEQLSLADLRGKPVLVTFWATDCPGCIREIPHLIALQQEFAPSGLAIVAIAMDYDPPNRVVAMAEQKQLPYYVTLDPDASHARAFGNIRLTPTTFLIDRAGHIVWRTVGVFDLDEMRHRLTRL
ncbi:MAG: TlpA family protein disulfide reductase [Methylomonas sp.]|nr:TlpA family protein disulfide reductase [Methylomonas sp.]PPD21212.1 MAG: thioredoxin [Methylomonas sp.]PPD27681.1 MAG: thioredoxin [Methylomonas sp.]PPD37880.1 MAG: thioredoxin [Methylomonas sp.]PPD39666.1 MAG: thioredoxin [Methylomonas sp.]